MSRTKSNFGPTALVVITSWGKMVSAGECHLFQLVTGIVRYIVYRFDVQKNFTKLGQDFMSLLSNLNSKDYKKKGKRKGRKKREGRRKKKKEGRNRK